MKCLIWKHYYYWFFSFSSVVKFLLNLYLLSVMCICRCHTICRYFVFCLELFEKFLFFLLLLLVLFFFFIFVVVVVVVVVVVKFNKSVIIFLLGTLLSSSPSTVFFLYAYSIFLDKVAASSNDCGTFFLTSNATSERFESKFTQFYSI